LFASEAVSPAAQTVSFVAAPLSAARAASLSEIAIVEFPGKATPVSEADAAAALVPAFAARFGRPIDRETAELLLALLFIENDHGRAIIEHNWGNISTFVKDGVDYWRPPWFDLEKIEAMPDNLPADGFGQGRTNDKKQRYLALHQRMLEHKVPSAFLAFPDHATGIRVWLANVKPSMYEAAETGDPMAFAHAYWASGYCPDQACKDSGPTYRSLQASIRAKGFFAGLEPAKKEDAAAAALPSLRSVPPVPPLLRSVRPPSLAGSSGARSGSGGIVSMLARDAVVLVANRELALVESGAFIPARVKDYWASALHQAPNLPHPPHWCGALALFCLHEAELARALVWRFQTATDKRSGFLYALARIKADEELRPGDMGYQDQPYQHHFIVETVDGDTVQTIDGNQGGERPIQRRTRKRSDRALAWSSIKRLLREDA
jgi:hypothetical protein